MSFPWNDYEEVSKEAVALIRERDSRGRNHAVDLYFEDVKDAVAWGRREVVVWRVEGP